VTSTNSGLHSQSDVPWVVPETWFLVPRERTAHAEWAADTAVALGRADAETNLLAAAELLVTDEPGISPFVVISNEEPFIDATGWLRAWDGSAGALALIDESFSELTAPQEGLHHFEIVDADVATSGACRALYTFQGTPVADEILEERVSAFLVDDAHDAVRQVTFVTTDVIAFDDPVGLAVEVLERSALAVGREG
jgi:hypothetical protein